ncbi:aspartyl/glutamyl-tRNA(Asn/Gln) amidotransferase subunit C [Oceanospirillum multiglobuliferum]|uniref:Aspartyl/glutamyl-tRNA(Asn/Gln) amidotransferase subunit C n=1 Tax=Oceanospirillum multiglobuliferum TaxID=64969 RepID=A0A1T4KV64_9GAMM|nr:Asp-tRNA(Asn)/Glu-tRNA(Gln) amidotransferase subunit GatC [Oceanospirillum multiglobuliferum]OPX54960.1 asparaginyl/glutamyl-tRNA amidotransferase subunit C [Oceanospirillum multiglobuliferum]SJZ46260.1 aspartyl/glutamyl-tRNA(Asn/Gln) amidotransferase subunit C [Oceanospirillum multiglobuliferum]
MALDQTDVEKVAHLARLQIEEQDIPEYTRNLTSILDLVSQMQAVDTDDIDPLAHPLDATQRLRHDEVTETNQREHFQKNAPAIEAGLFLVPKVIE